MVAQTNKKFQEILKILDSYNNQKIALSISGGPDSMALLHLFIENYNNKNFIVVNFNHKLRKEADEEAILVKNYCEKYNIENYLLEWPKNIPLAENQKDARDVRYQEIFTLCQKLDLKHLVTAHQKDDVCENLFIRINRGSGLRGLANSVNLISRLQIDNFNMFTSKPLIIFEKTELLNYLHQKNIPYAIDKSNSSNKYLRNRVRKFLDNESEIDKNHILITALNLNNSNNFIEREILKIRKKFTTLYPFNVAEISFEIFNEDPGLVKRIISDILLDIGKLEYPPRLHSLNKLFNKLSLEKSLKTTLGNCIIENDIKNNCLYIYPEEIPIFNKNLLQNTKISILKYEISLSKKSEFDYKIINLTSKIWEEINCNNSIPYIFKKFRYYLPVFVCGNLNIPPQIPTLIKDKFLDVSFEETNDFENFLYQDYSNQLINLLQK